MFDSNTFVIFTIILGVIFLFLFIRGILRSFGYIEIPLKDLSNTQPFADVVGKEHVLKRPIFLAVFDTDTPEYWMKDEKKDWGDVDLNPDKWFELAKGTKIRLNKAKFTSFLSEISPPFLIGEFCLEEIKTSIQFKYQWGTVLEDSSTPDIVKSWRIYELAPWQDVALDGTWPNDPRKSR